MSVTASPSVSLCLLQADHLACERDGRELFSGLALHLEPGALVELQGPNGSGKTTLLRGLAGLHTDLTGTLQLHAALLYQGHKAGINGLLSPRENLAWYAALQGLMASPAVLDQALVKMGLAGYEDSPCQQLSAGQQRRVLLARLALNLAPAGALLWLLDEPLTALDTAGISLLQALLLARVASGGAVICATHQSLSLTSARILRLGLH